MKILQMKKRLLTAGIALTLLAALIPSMGADAASTYTVNLNKTYQTIQGFGGMNHPIWISDLTSSQINTSFGNESNQLGLNILRIHVDENKNNWSRELATAKAAVAKGAIVFATPWNPPSSMTETITKNGRTTKRLKYNSYGAYADYLNEFVSYMKTNGVELYAISIQNEPDWGYEWTWWEPNEVYNFTKNYAGKINCRVISAESFSYNKSYYNNILNDASALANVDIVATHFYGTTESQMSYSLYNQKASDKPLWMTEVYVPNSNEDADVWPSALNVATNISSAMSNNFSAYVWWYIRRSYGLIKENGNISKRGYCMAQYSKFVLPGYKRVDTIAKPDTNVYVTAYTGDGKAVVVVANNTSSSLTKTISITGGNVSNCVSYRTSASENLAQTKNININNNAISASLPSYSVTTYVFDLGSSSQSGNNNGNEGGNETVNRSTNIQCEEMTLSGSYAGKISSPFSGVALYANSDKASFTQYFGYGSHDFTLTGASSNGKTATVDLYISGEKKGTFRFTGTSPQAVTLNNISHATGNVKIELQCANDDNTWDAYIDVFQIYSAGSGSTQENQSGSNNQGSSSQQPTEPTQPIEPTQPTEPSTPSSSNLKVSYTINNWGSGYQVNFKISNNTGNTVNGWTLKVKKNDIKIDSSWNVNIKESGDYYVITPVSWNSSISNGSSVEFGVQGSGSIGTSISCSL